MVLGHDLTIVTDTGDRPYMCVLCRDTFSRSDILKRHFIKCSVRRGNPTGASHLSHPQAHVKKNAGAQQKAMGAEGEVGHMNGMGNIPAADGMVHPFGLIPAQDGMNNIANDQSQLSRSSSINRLDETRDRRSMTASVMGGATTRGGSFDQNYNGGDVATNMSANINPQLANYSMPQVQNGMPVYGGSGSTDWSQMFSSGAQNTYVDNKFMPNVGQTQTAIKLEPSADPARVVGIPDGDVTDPTIFPAWGVPSTYPDSYQQLSTKILNFFCIPGTYSDPATAGTIVATFQPDNIRNFLHNYTHFHAHFPILHVPTFRATEAFVGLVAGMCCVGACYSDRVSPANVRAIMGFLKTGLERCSGLFQTLSAGPNASAGFEWSSLGDSDADLEELQAAMLVESLFLWHGTPAQREAARRTFPLIASLARKAGLLGVSKDATLYSPTHQSDLAPGPTSTSNFDWTRWVEQEKRLRLMYLIFLCDVALAVYFNSSPEFDPFEIRLPLPTDDAAWEANSAVGCAQALGLHGPIAARTRNPDGTMRPTQPEMHLLLKALLDNSSQIRPGATNLFGKFILVHALLAILRRAQVNGSQVMLGRSSTPLPQNAWFVEACPSDHRGRSMPPVVGANLLDRQAVKVMWSALEKFKTNWDQDMAIQYPLGLHVHPRRCGFSEDGIRFYWLATYLLNNTQATDLQMSPDQKLAHTLNLLERVKDWVAAGSASRGEPLGFVGKIEADYGAMDMTLDIKQLFKPLPRTAVKSEKMPAASADSNCAIS